MFDVSRQRSPGWDGVGKLSMLKVTTEALDG